jgi:LysM repeat protein
MKLFRLRRKPDSGEDERELVLDTDTQAEDQAKDPTEGEAEASAEAPAPEASAPTQEEAQPPEAAPPIQGDAPAPEGDLLARIGAEANREMEAEEKASQGEGGTPQGDDSLDPDLLDIFREAKNEVVESTLASELEDIPVNDLLSDLVGISRRLGATPRAHPEPGPPPLPDPRPEPSTFRNPGPPAEPTTLRSLSRPAESTTLGSLSPPARPSAIKASGPITGARAQAPPACPYGSGAPRSEGQSPIAYGRHIQLGLFIALVAATAVGGALWGVGQLGGSQPGLEPPAVAAPVAAAVVRQESQPDAAVLAAVQAPSEPDSEAILRPTSEAYPAYSLYIVQRGDTVSSLARAFGISSDYILWNNQDVNDDPHFLVVGQELLIPDIGGIIYQVKPGDTLPEIAASHQIDVESIVAFAPNGLTSPDDNIEGMILLLPGAMPPPPSSG